MLLIIYQMFSVEFFNSFSRQISIWFHNEFAICAVSLIYAPRNFRATRSEYEVGIFTPHTHKFNLTIIQSAFVITSIYTIRIDATTMNVQCERKNILHTRMTFLYAYLKLTAYRVVLTLETHHTRRSREENRINFTVHEKFLYICSAFSAPVYASYSYYYYYYSVHARTNAHAPKDWKQAQAGERL